MSPGLAAHQDGRSRNPLSRTHVSLACRLSLVTRHCLFNAAYARDLILFRHALLLITQGNHRIDSHRAPRRHQTGDERDDEQQ